MGTERRTFYGPDIDIPSLAQALADNFLREGYQTQVVPVSATGLMVQARKEDTLRKIAGMSSALSAVLDLEGEYVSVEMGGAKWADKGVAAGVGAIIFFPALITAGVGAYQQSQLTSKAWQFVEQFIRAHSAFGGSAMPGGGLGAIPQTPQFQQSYQQPHYQQPPYQQPFQPPGGMMPGAGQPMPMRGPGGPPAPINMGAGPQAPTAGVVCASCNQVMPPGSKFCMACGAPASKTCFTCGAEVQPSARFCNNCGTPVSR
jgi:hypothetical protein